MYVASGRDLLREALLWCLALIAGGKRAKARKRKTKNIFCVDANVIFYKNNQKRKKKKRRSKWLKNMRMLLGKPQNALHSYKKKLFFNRLQCNL